MGYSRASRLDLLDHPQGSWSLIHAGDVGATSAPGFTTFCKNADLLLLPAGGTYTIGPREAERFANEINARDVILMHFREDGIDLPMLSPQEAFSQMNSSVQIHQSGHFGLNELPKTSAPRFHWLKGQNTREMSRP